MAGLGGSQAAVVAALREYRKDLAAELASTDRAIEALGGEAPAPPAVAAAAPVRLSPRRRKVRRTKPTRAAAKRGKKKASKASKRRSRPVPARAARPPKQRAVKPTTDDAPVPRRGRPATSGVESRSCDTLAERQKLIEKLKSEGYERATGRLVPGTFVVYESSSGDVTVQWRPPAKVAA